MRAPLPAPAWPGAASGTEQPSAGPRGGKVLLHVEMARPGEKRDTLSLGVFGGKVWSELNLRKTERVRSLLSGWMIGFKKRKATKRKDAWIPGSLASHGTLVCRLFEAHTSTSYQVGGTTGILNDQHGLPLSKARHPLLAPTHHPVPSPPP